MIEKLRESGDKAFGFKVSGKLTAGELKAFEPEIERAIADRGKRTIGILADLSAAKGAEWAAQWEELRFLGRFADHIERVAVVGAHSWEDLKAEILAGTVLVRSGSCLGMRRHATDAETGVPGPDDATAWDRLTVTFSTPYSLAEEVLSYGADAYAEEPAEVREIVVRRLRAVVPEVSA